MCGGESIRRPRRVAQAWPKPDSDPTREFHSAPGLGNPACRRQRSSRSRVRCDRHVRSSGRTPGRSHCVAEAGVGESLRCIAAAGIEVEIARDHETRAVDVLAAVRKDLVQLPESKFVGASALQVKIVGHHLASADSCFRYESDPAAGPALKSREIGHIPTRFPERGLVAETNRSWPSRAAMARAWPCRDRRVCRGFPGSVPETPSRRRSSNSGDAPVHSQCRDTASGGRSGRPPARAADRPGVVRRNSRIFGYCNPRFEVPAQDAKGISRPRPRRTEAHSTQGRIIHGTSEPGSKVK